MTITPAIELVPVQPLREAFLASGLTAYHVAREIGWMRPRCGSGRPQADSTRLRRALGLASTRNGENSNRYYCRRIGYDRALLIAEAIGVDPWEVGL